MKLSQKTCLWKAHIWFFGLYAPPPTRSGSAAAPRWNPRDSRGLVVPAKGNGATAIRNNMSLEAAVLAVFFDARL